jgi:Tfp pilus assembly protein PilF
MSNENGNFSSSTESDGQRSWRNIRIALSRAILRVNELDVAQENLDDALEILERLVNDASISSEENGD